MNPNPFSAQAKSLDVSVTSTASASQALPGAGNSIRIVNEGPNIAFLSIGSGSQTATLPTNVSASVVATCTPVAVGDCVLGIPNDQTYNVSAICRATQTARLTIQVSEGL